MIETAFLDLLRCPLCKGKLVSRAEEFLCPTCERHFPVVLGIPDLRVYPDPYISLEDDHRKGEILQERASSLDFAGLVRFYWQITPETPADLKERFIRHVLTDEDRANSLLERLWRPSDARASCLDVGCGTGAFLKVAAKKFSMVLSCDIAFRWLVVARKRLVEAGAPANLVCCCADFLPFPGDSFDWGTAISLLEHVPDSEAVVRECGRVLKKGGSLVVVSTNRYSLAAEPHVGLWGVGFLPRRWMPAYVRWRKGLSYDKFRLPSCCELRRYFRRAGFGSVSFSFPRISKGEQRGLTWLERTGVQIYSFLSRVRLFKWPLILFSPLLQAVGRKKIAGIAPPIEAGHSNALLNSGGTLRLINF